MIPYIPDLPPPLACIRSVMSPPMNEIHVGCEGLPFQSGTTYYTNCMSPVYFPVGRYFTCHPHEM